MNIDAESSENISEWNLLMYKNKYTLNQVGFILDMYGWFSIQKSHPSY